MFSVVERFVSINGESVRAGELAAFIRFKGCNLSCSYCDTKWANSTTVPFEYYTADQLTSWVKDKRVRNVTLTGGEPLLQDEIDDLIEHFGAQGNRVEIETNGSIPLDAYVRMQYRPTLTMDYKLPSSGMESAMRTDNFRLLEKQDAVKFVAGSVDDLNRVREVIGRFGLTERCNVFISPVYGKIEPSEIVEFMTKHGMNDVRLQLQLHKFIWNPSRRGV